jgi:hypothetical protein
MKGDQSKYMGAGKNVDGTQAESFQDDSSMDDAKQDDNFAEPTNKERSVSSGRSFGKAGKDALSKRR